MIPNQPASVLDGPFALSINGAAAALSDDTDGDSYFEIHGSLSLATGDVVTLFVDDEVEKAVAVTVAGEEDTTVHLYEGYLILRHDNNGSLTNTNLDTADNSADSDITDIYSVAADGVMTVAGTVTEVFIPTGHTYAPGNGVIAPGFDINGAFNFASSTITNSGAWDATGGSFTSTNSTVVFTSTLDQNITSNSSSFDDLIINDGLVGYWKLDESTTPSHDSSGYFNHGTWNGTPTFSSSIASTINFANPGSAQFDADADFINIPPSRSLDEVYDNDRITVSVWSINDATPVQYDSIIGNPSDDNWNDGYGLYYNSATEIRFYLSTWNVNEAVANINPLVWNHIVGVYDGSNVRIFVNGVEGTADSYTGVIVDSGAPITIGKHEGLGAYNIVGKVDEARIYNRALSVQEIQRLANGNMPAASTATFTLQDNLDINGAVILNSGELDIGSNRTVNVGGSWLNYGGIFDEKTGQVTLDSPSGTIDILEMQTFYDLILNDGGGSVMFELNAALDVNRDLTITGGSLDVTGSLWPMNIQRHWTNNDTFNAQTGTVTLDATSGVIDIKSNSSAFYNLKLDDDGGSATFELEDALDVNGTLSIDGGTLDAKSGSNFGINVGGNWLNSDTFTSRNGLVTLDGDSQIITGANEFWDFTKQDTTNNGVSSTVTFPTGVTTTIKDDLVLTGLDADDLIRLRS